MQRHIDRASGRACISASEIQERIKRRGRICVQKCRPQARLAGLAYGKVLAIVSRIPETQFPVPRLEVIGDPPHFATQPEVEELIPVSELLMPRPGVVNTTEANTGRDRETRSIREEVWNRCVSNSERIKRIGKWHADAGRTKERPICLVERIRCKRYRCEGRIEK